MTAGWIHTIALKSDGTLWAWGYNYDGQLGLGDSYDRYSPVKVPISGVMAVAAGAHTLALKSDGTLWAWGVNEYGELGLGDTVNRYSPVQVPIGGVVSVAAGYAHTVALKSDGTLWAWGRNHTGQLGLGDTVDRYSPVKVPISGVATVTADVLHTVALKSDGTVWVWGWNRNGQLGLGDTVNRYSPTQIPNFNLGSDDHGNSINEATKIGVDSRTAGRIDYTGDNDFFRLQVSKAGILTVYTLGTTDTYGYLLDSRGHEVNEAHDDDSGENVNFHITRAVSPGTYYVRVRHYSSSGTGAYTLVAKFTVTNGKAQRAVLLLHGMNSAPDTWNTLVSKRWSGKCEEIYNGNVLESIPVPAKDSLGAVCYRLKFGRYDKTGFTGLENQRCPNDKIYGCSGDFTAIYAPTSNDDLGVEVFAAVRDIRRRLGSNTQVVLLGHSRGGLAARAFLQRPVSSAERGAVVGLVTTGTPHRGSPLGRIYPYLKTYCLDGNGKRINSSNPASKPKEVWSACDDDWKAAEWLMASLDLRRPTIGFLAPNSSQIQAINAASSVANLPAKLSVVQLRYAGQYIGHLARVYSAWDRPGEGDVNENFSIHSRDYALCGRVILGICCATTENDPAFDGDGIVPKTFQSIPGFESKTLPGTAGTYHVTIKKIVTVSTGETDRVQDIATALGRVEAWK